MGHMIMFDGKSYRFGARGQFWIIRGGGFSMQGETVGINTKKGNSKEFLRRYDVMRLLIT